MKDVNIGAVVTLSSGLPLEVIGGLVPSQYEFAGKALSDYRLIRKGDRVYFNASHVVEVSA